jgi:hypothetical protein
VRTDGCGRQAADAEFKSPNLDRFSERGGELPACALRSPQPIGQRADALRAEVFTTDALPFTSVKTYQSVGRVENPPFMEAAASPIYLSIPEAARSRWLVRALHLFARFLPVG